MSELASVHKPRRLSLVTVGWLQALFAFFIAYSFLKDELFSLIASDLNKVVLYALIALGVLALIAGALIFAYKRIGLILGLVAWSGSLLVSIFAVSQQYFNVNIVTGTFGVITILGILDCLFFLARPHIRQAFN